MLKFLAHENIASRIIIKILENGFDIKRIDKISPGLSDDDIIEIAQKENRIILTHDKDFANIYKYPLKKHEGVILIRLKNQSPKNVIKYLIPLIKQGKEKLNNSLAILNEQGTRIYKNN